MKRKISFVPLFAAASAVALLAGCSSVAGSSPNAFGKTISTAPSAGNSSTWVKWDKSSCSFVNSTAAHPKVWTAETRKPTSKFTVGFGAQDTTNEVNTTMNSSMTQSSKDAGVDLAFANYEFPSTSAPASAARSIVTRDPAVIVSNNQVDTLLDSVNNIYKQACIPVVQVVTAAKGTILYGPSNPDMGKLEGQRLVEFAKAKGWNASNITLMTTFFSPAGPEVAKRASECAAGVKQAFPGIKSVSNDTTSTTALELQNQFTDLLTANPGAKNILTCTIADLWAISDANALKLGGRTATSAVTGVNGGSAVLDAIKQGDTPLVGTVDLGAASWGKYWIPLAEDIASGKAVPDAVYSPIKMLPAALPE
jgi:ABC-type sugar transport system substrate-binding protein